MGAALDKDSIHNTAACASALAVDMLLRFHRRKKQEILPVAGPPANWKRSPIAGEDSNQGKDQTGRSSSETVYRRIT